MLTRGRHALRQSTYFPVGHAGIEYSHQKSGGLVIGNGAICVSVNEKGDFFGGQFFAVPLAVYKVDRTHCILSG